MSVKAGKSKGGLVMRPVCKVLYFYDVRRWLPNHVLPAQRLSFENEVVEPPRVAVLVSRLGSFSNRHFDSHRESLQCLPFSSCVSPRIPIEFLSSFRSFLSSASEFLKAAAHNQARFRTTRAAPLASPSWAAVDFSGGMIPLTP